MAAGASEATELTSFVDKLEKSHLITTDATHKKKIKLKAFNENLKTASSNLGIIIPDIVEISKEQVALINHGLEGVLSFIQAFQTVNTTFAILAENPEKAVLFSNKLKDVQDLEGRVIDDVKESLKNLDTMLGETFKEVSVYYDALGQIIYSEEAGGKIEIKYKRNDPELAEMMNKIYRRESKTKEHELEKSLGLIQLIETLDKVSRKIKKIKIGETTQKYYLIKTTKGAEIKLDIEIFNALQSLSGELLDSLKNVGFLVDDEVKGVKKVESEVFQAKILSNYGVRTALELEKTLEKKRKVVDFFIKKASDINKLEQFQKERDNTERAEIFQEITKLKKEKKDALAVHDEIIKAQIKIINKVVNVFANIVSLWGDQVDNEIHIGQVADKAAKSLKKLAKVQLKINKDADEQTLLVAASTQDEIRKTSEKAKDLKTVGKVMQFLLERVKTLISFNEGLENQIKKFHSSTKKADEYMNNKLEKVKELTNNKYPKMKNKINKIIKKFDKNLRKLGNDENLFQNMRLLDEFEQNYKIIDEEMEEFIQKVNVKTEDVNASNFEEYCKNLGVPLDELDNKIDHLFDNFNKLSKTFRDDFEKYMKVSDAYRSFVKELSPMLDLISYVISLERKLAEEKIDLKNLNYRIKAFQNLFNKLKESQKQQAELDNNLKEIMKKLGMKKNYFSEYAEKLDKEFNNLFSYLQDFTKQYFNDEKKMKIAYEGAEKWIKEFEVDFSDYNRELKNMKIGFFQKLFKTQSYKKSEFWKELNTIKNSFEKYDKMIKKLGGINLKKAENVETFCKNSVILINELLKGYQDLMNELYNSVNTMSFVLENLQNLTSEGYINTFQKMLESFRNLNAKLDETEKKTYDLKEFEQFNVSDTLEKLRNVTNFENLSNATNEQKIKLEEYNKELKNDAERVRKTMLEFFLKYLTQPNIYPADSEKGRKYREMLSEITK